MEGNLSLAVAPAEESSCCWAGSRLSYGFLAKEGSFCPVLSRQPAPGLLQYSVIALDLAFVPEFSHLIIILIAQECYKS